MARAKGLSKHNENLYDLRADALQKEQEFAKQVVNIDNILSEDINLDRNPGRQSRQGRQTIVPQDNEDMFSQPNLRRGVTESGKLNWG